MNLIHMSEETTLVFVKKVEVSGNEKTNTLDELRLMNYEPSFWVSIVGKGVTKGENSYFLIRTITKDDSNEKYFCISANATYEELVAMQGTYEVPENCESYKSDVDNMEFLTEDDVPKGLTDFNNSTIFLE